MGPTAPIAFTLREKGCEAAREIRRGKGFWPIARSNPYGERAFLPGSRSFKRKQKRRIRKQGTEKPESGKYRANPCPGARFRRLAAAGPFLLSQKEKRKTSDSPPRTALGLRGNICYDASVMNSLCRTARAGEGRRDFMTLEKIVCFAIRQRKPERRKRWISLLLGFHPRRLYRPIRTASMISSLRSPISSEYRNGSLKMISNLRSYPSMSGWSSTNRRELSGIYAFCGHPSREILKRSMISCEWNIRDSTPYRSTSIPNA